MGADLIEIIYRVEDEFELIIPDGDVEKMTSPRQVVDYLMNKTEIGEKCSRDYIEISLWRIIEEETGISPRDFDDDARFVEDMGFD
jgi:acyl carrier protein